MPVATRRMAKRKEEPRKDETEEARKRPKRGSNDAEKIVVDQEADEESCDGPMQGRVFYN